MVVEGDSPEDGGQRVEAALRVAGVGDGGQAIQQRHGNHQRLLPGAGSRRIPKLPDFAKVISRTALQGAGGHLDPRPPVR